MYPISVIAGECDALHNKKYVSKWKHPEYQNISYYEIIMESNRLVVLF